MPKFEIYDEVITIKIDGSPDELLKVKRLPGRTYDPETQSWIVPIVPGLSRSLEEEYGNVGSQIGAVIEEREKHYTDRLAAPPVSPADLWRIPAENAINMAVTHHLYAAHNGDRSEYARVHYPYVIGA